MDKFSGHAWDALLMKINFTKSINSENQANYRPISDLIVSFPMGL